MMSAIFKLYHHAFNFSPTGVGIAINCMSVNQSFCVTGSEDGYLRLWPLDFSNVFLEAGTCLNLTDTGISCDRQVIRS